MHHTREEVIQRTIREFDLLDNLVANLKDEDWELLLIRSETKDPWTVKDAVAHITHWKADVLRKILKQRPPAEYRGLMIDEGNHLIFVRWHDRPYQEVLAWHRQVQKDLLDGLRQAPDEYFSGRNHPVEWPYDLDGHSASHRIKDIERVLKAKRPGGK